MDGRKTRRLGSFERAEALTAERFAFNVVVVLRCVGGLEDRALRGALDEVQRRHPLLRARISGSGRRRRFALGVERRIPLEGADRPDDHAWRGVVEEELGTGFDVATGPLARAVRLGGDRSRFELVLTFHHAIVDAAAVRHLVQELLDLCSGRDGERPSPQELPASADELFPVAYRAPRRWPASLRFLAAQALDEIRFRWRARGRPRPALESASRCRVLSLALTETETAAFVRATRRRRVGLYAALSAAMLLAVVGKRYDGRSGPHRYFAFPLLRPYLSPPVAPDVVAGYLTTMRLTLSLAPERGLWEAARQVHTQVDRAAKRGERYLASRWSAASMAMLLRQPTRMGTTALNYAGATPLDLAEDAPFSVGGFHAFVTNFPRGPEYTGQSRIFDGRLWWDVVYLDSDMEHDDAQAVAHSMRDLVLAGSAQEMEASG